ncbi:MAG TPA: FG-GAP-like repeat-containing protein [Pyrinomonadaceae bacterium]
MSVYRLLSHALRISLVTLFVWLHAPIGVVAQCKSSVFTSAPAYAADRQPNSVAVGEFNGDGKLDLAVANVGSDNVSILLGDGFGGFGPPSNLPVKHQPSTVAVGDFNKDGKTDLAIGYIFFSPISVLFGNGNGGFSSPNNVGGSANATDVAVADFNNDSNPDIAVSSAGPQLMLLGNGSGGFTSSNVSVGSLATSVAVGDLNGDSFPDAAFTAGGSVALVFGNAAGSFSVNSSVIVSEAPKGIAIGNFNADSQPDLIVVGEHATPKVFLFTNQGGGTFTLSTSFFAGREPRAVTTGDFNADGKLDVAVSLANGNSVMISLGNGLGNLATPTFYGTGAKPLSIGSGDFNADGKLDLVTTDDPSSSVAPLATGGVSVLLGTGTGAFQSYRAYVYPFTSQFVFIPNSIAVGDFNNNSRPDLALSFGAPFVGIMLDDGQGEFIQPTGFLDPGGNPVSIAVSDLNGDNNADFVTANNNTGNISIFFGHGNGSFMPRVQIAVNSSPRFVAVGDVNGDLKRDLIVTHESQNAVILLGDGIGGFAPPGGSPPPAFFEIAVGDFNADGKSDVAAGNFPSSNSVSVFLGDATGHLNLSSTTPSPGTITLMRLHVADLNADSRQDLLVGNTDRNNMSVFLGNGGGALSAGTDFATGFRPFDLATADFNGDGNLDVAVANNSGYAISLFSGDGMGGLSSPVPYPVGVNPNGLARGDFNQDTKPDLAVLSGTSYGLAVLKNVTTPLPCLSVNDVTVTEGDAGSVSLDFVISLSQSSLQTVRVNYSLVNETATKGTDYTDLSDRLAFAPGETSKTISVPILADTIDEIDETFKLQLASPSAAAISDAEGRGTILDNDPIPTLSINDISNVEAFLLRNFTVTLSSPSGKEIKVQYATADGTAAGGSQPAGDYFPASGTLTIPAGQGSAQIGVNVFDDPTFEPDETFFLNLSNPTNVTINDAQGQATILNNDPFPTVTVDDAFANEGNSGTTQMLFIVRLSNPTSQAVTLDYVLGMSTTDNPATPGTDFVSTPGSLTFAPGEVLKTVGVPIIGDTVDETVEMFLLNLINIQNANNFPDTGFGFIIDDDGPTISISDVSVTEGNAGTKSATFTLTLSAPSVETITVRATTAAGTATSPTDYSFFNPNLSIPAGTVTRVFSITIIGDTNLESDETFFVNLSNPFNATIADAQGVGTILDDDTLRLSLEQSAPDPQQAAAFDALLLLRDPFPIRSIAQWFYSTPDQNTRVMIFAQNLQLQPGESASAVIVNLVDSSNQSFDVPAEDVRGVANVNFTQVVFRLPDTLASGVCRVTIKAHGQTSDGGNIRIIP